MNTVKLKNLYERLTTPTEVLEEREAEQTKAVADEAFRAIELEQRKYQWLKDPVTVQFLHNLKEAHDKSLSYAKVNAGYDNPEINKKLVIADTIEKVINHARTSSPLD